MIFILFFLALLVFYQSFKYVNLKKNIKIISDNLKFREKSGSVTHPQLSSKNEEILDLYEQVDNIFIEKAKKDEDIYNLTKEYSKTVSNLSHDLRTPLTTIIGYLNLIEPKDKDRELLKTAISKAYFLNDLVEKFYQLSLINEKTGLEFDNFDLKEVIYQIAFNYFEKFEGKNQNLDLKIEEQLEVTSNKNSFETILTNILDNMYKYSLGNNKIIGKNDGKLYLEFSNDINAANGNYDFLFERSKVLDPSRKNATGIGLSIVKAHLDKLFLKSEIYVWDKRFYIIIKE